MGRIEYWKRLTPLIAPLSLQQAKAPTQNSHKLIHKNHSF